MSRWELEFQTTLMRLLRLTRDLRGHDCEHCGKLLNEVYNCLDKETQDIRDRANNA
jgi:hypothetical protein